MSSISNSSIAFKAKVLTEIDSFTSNSLPVFGKHIESLIKSFKKNEGIDAFADLIRLSGAIPETIKADSTEEKRYSKFTDVLLSMALSEIGLNSAVLDSRSDSADVEAVGRFGINLVGDAKAFRMSRTAKNQKDFKVQAMHKWKNGKPYALLVCPIYQLPAKTSQIYYQAETNDVCIFTYSHLCVLLKLAVVTTDKSQAQKLLSEVFKNSFSLLTPSKNAYDYWKSINSIMVNFSQESRHLWNKEKLMIDPTIQVGKSEALKFYQTERTRILSLSRQDAINEILALKNIDTKIQCIQNVSNNLDLE